jgi:hypothetical protein
MVEIVLGGAVVRVPPEVAGKLLAKVLRAAEAGCEGIATPPRSRPAWWWRSCG